MALRFAHGLPKSLCIEDGTHECDMGARDSDNLSARRRQDLLLRAAELASLWPDIGPSVSHNVV